MVIAFVGIEGDSTQVPQRLEFSTWCALVEPMKVFNENATFEFFKEFEELVRNSSLEGKAGMITLFTDWTSLETCASFTPLDEQAPSLPAGRGTTPSDLFVQVMVAIDCR